MQGLIGRQLVCVKSSSPETFAVETHIPVGEVVVYEVVDEACRAGRLIIVKRFGDILHEGIEQGENPAVDFRTLGQRHLRFCAGETIHIGVEGQERVCVVEGREEFA